MKTFERIRRRLYWQQLLRRKRRGPPHENGASLWDKIKSLFCKKNNDDRKL